MRADADAMDVPINRRRHTQDVPNHHPDMWVMCPAHQGPWKLPGGACPKCGRYTNAYWKQCGHCAYRTGTCSGCLTPLDAGVLADSRADHERRLGRTCDEL